MNIPDTVKIGGYNYKVDHHDGPIPSGSHVYDGLYDSTINTITLSDIGDKSYKDTVFLHELIHGIIYVYCADKQDEEFVEQFAKGLYQVIFDNPKIFENN
mgnify:CR=1 FL=1